MYLDREIVISKKDAALLFAWLFVFGCVLHLTTTLSFVNDTFSKYIQTTYLVKSTFGGVFFSIFVYIVNLFTHTVASYVLYAVALIVLSAVISQNIYQNFKSGNLRIKKTNKKAEINNASSAGLVKDKQEKQQETALTEKSKLLSEQSVNAEASGKVLSKTESVKPSSNDVFVSDEEFADDFADSSEELERQRKAEIMLGLAKNKNENDNIKPNKNDNMKGSAYVADGKYGAVNTDNSDFSSKRPRKFVHDIITTPRKKSKIVEEGKTLSDTDKKNLEFLRSTIGGRSKTKYDFNKDNVLEEKPEEEVEIIEEHRETNDFELEDYLTSEIYKTNKENNEASENKVFNKRPALFTDNNELIVNSGGYEDNKFNINKQTVSENDFDSSINNSMQNTSMQSAFKQNNNLSGHQRKHFTGSGLPKKKAKYVKPPLELLKRYESDSEDLSSDYQEKAKMLEDTLASFKINASVVSVTKGPAFTRFEMQMAHGISVKRVTSYIDDIAMVLESQGAVRVEIPIPGKNAFGVEVPNESITIVGLKDIIESYSFEGSKSKLTFALGKDITGESKVARIDKMPHLLVAGSTGSGKSVCLNSMLISLVYKASPEDLKLILIDPKRVEFTLYNGFPHSLVPNVITDPEKAVSALNWTIDEMERRFSKFSKNKVRNLEEYNQLPNVTSGIEKKMPFIVVVIDELSDLMMINKKDIEDLGGTMRLGLFPCKIKPDTRAAQVYQDEIIYERHRHRYELNNLFRGELEKSGLVMSGTSPDDRLVEMIELPDHPWFVATQFHPEFKSRPNRAHPLFRDFITAALQYKKNKE